MLVARFISPGLLQAVLSIRGERETEPRRAGTPRIQVCSRAPGHQAGVNEEVQLSSNESVGETFYLLGPRFLTVMGLHDTKLSAQRIVWRLISAL